MDLSIVVPTFNSSKTINATLASLEIIIKYCSGKLIIVDDGSSDNTINIIENWKKKLHSKLVFIKHKNNLGGGAARNTGINAANTTYVLVCDSDDISDLESIKKLFATASNHEWGGAHYQYAHYFRTNHKKIDSIDNYREIFKTNKVKIEDALANSLLVNFLFKKENWIKAGGYPEHHGWDTQGFSIRYLTKNPGILVADNSFYYHRRFFGNYSYYERENMSGRTFLNSWLTVEEMLGLIPDSWFNDILNSSILSKESSLDIVKRNVNNYRKMHNNAHSLNENTNPYFSSFVKGILEYKEGKFEKSQLTLNNLFVNNDPSEIVLFTNLRSSIAKSFPSKSNSSFLAFQFLQNIGKFENSLRTSRIEHLKKAFKIH